MPRNNKALSDEKRAAVVAYYQSGYSMSETAVRFGVSVQTVQNSLRRLQVMARPYTHKDKPTRICLECRKEKPLKDFPSDGSRRTMRGYRCRPCHKEACHYRRVKCLFGLSREQYDSMVEEQKGLCAICGRHESSGRRLAVDHNHATGRVRGLLCQACNTTIGKMGDCPTLLRKAAEYVEADGFGGIIH